MRLRINGFPISSEFGSIDSVHKIPHTGVDIAMPIGTQLHSVGGGVISQVDVIGDRSLGRMVRIDLDDGPDVIYGHLSQVNVKIGDHVHAGDIIGLSGNTGHSTGPHLHLQAVADNGTLIDPTPIAHAASEPGFWSSVLDKFNDFSDWAIGKETEIIAKPVGNMAWNTVKRTFEAISVHSAEIITLGICACAIGMMIGPIIGSGNKWLGRLFVVFWGGIIWRVVT
ncbi:M23 family metallopeptidase [Cohnella yongneupensis]|uniref:M23 family metallopeptidase n=1 Tax=Cohnella yongneupensis TaxID=425006 RepID=A0ABW0QVY4_9BACL